MDFKLEGRKNFYLEVVATALTAAYYVFMLVHNLMHSALWADEWVEYRISNLNLLNGEMYHEIIGTFQPPLYNYVMHFWLLINDSIVFYRSFNVIIAIISALVLYFTVKRIRGQYWGLFSVVVLGSTYQWIYVVQECSEYALMLMFLFIMLYFFVRLNERFCNKDFILFLLSGIAAIYSQYGAAIVVVPFFLILLIDIVFNKTIDSSVKIKVFISYVVSAIVFGAPLLYFFAIKQMKHNEIANHVGRITIDDLIDLPLTLGSMIGFFTNLNSIDSWLIVLPLFGLIVLCFMIHFAIRKTTGRLSRLFYAALTITYLLHFFLVKLNIYSNLGPNFNVGFCSRYSLFWLPALIILLNILLMDLEKLIKFKFFNVVVIILVFFVALNSAFLTSKNWNKAYDDMYADIWFSNKGYEETTFVFGDDSPGFNYYVTHHEGFEESMLNSVVYVTDEESETDLDNLPESFWTWRSFWLGYEAQDYYDAAREQGYEVTIYHDAQDEGQLVHFVKSA